jgi:hypothetical protein
MLFLLPFAQVFTKLGLVLQSDNRIEYQSQFEQFELWAHDQGLAYKSYGCFAKGWPKVELVQKACDQGYDYVVWVDSDAEPQNTHLKFGNDIKRLLADKVLVAGLENVDQLTWVKNPFLLPINTYHDYFNDGTFAVNCTTAQDLLYDWKHLAFHWEKITGTVSDQLALQIMARKNTIYEGMIAYDVRVFGQFSVYFQHFPGWSRNKMQFVNSKLTPEPLACPIPNATAHRVPNHTLISVNGAIWLSALICACFLWFRHHLVRAGTFVISWFNKKRDS